MRSMLFALLISTIALAAQPTAAQLDALRTFRAEFISITPGKGMFPATFTMGSASGPASESPPRQVTIGRAFHIARYEVPQDLWEAVMGGNPSRWKGPRNSVEMLSLAEAQEFCRRATTLMRAAGLIGERQLVRLPSEAEWEYIARAGTATRYSFGDDPRELDAYAWHTGNAAGNDPPVGAKKPNPWGLYDVHGYLWEWCADTWHGNHEGAPLNASARDGADRQLGVLRSGSWKDAAEHLTSSFRRAAAVDTRDDAVGLRCVLAEE